MDRADMERETQSAWKAFLSRPPKDTSRLIIQSTSGTTGTPLVVINHMDRERAAERFGDAERIVLGVGSMGGRLRHIVHARYANGPASRRILPVAPTDTGPELSALLGDFHPDLLFGITAIIARVSEHIGGTAASSVRRVWLAGELLSSAMRDRLAGMFANASFEQEYRNTELDGAIGVSCPHQPSNVYHPAPGVIVEIDAPDEAGIGMLLVSKRVGDIAVTRYTTGDSGSFIPESCACGAKVTFRHMGRIGYDYLKIAGALLRREELDRLATLFSHYIDDYRAEAGEVVEDGHMKGKLILHLYTAAGAPVPAEQIAHELSRRLFLTPTRTLAALVEEGHFVPLIVQFSDAPFPSGNKQVKIRRLL